MSKINTTPTRRQQLLQASAQAVLDLLAAGISLDRVTVPMIAGNLGFSNVYISTRVGLQEAKNEAIRAGLAERHPQLVCQLALAGDRRVRKIPNEELVKAFRSAIA